MLEPGEYPHDELGRWLGELGGDRADYQRKHREPLGHMIFISEGPQRAAPSP